jgi:hypothetical protein
VRGPAMGPARRTDLINPVYAAFADVQAAGRL